MPTRNLADFPVPPATGACAITDLSGAAPRQVGFAEYRARIDAVAAMLARRGLARGSRIGLIGRNSADYLFAYFGIMQAGLVAVPINHRFPAEMVGFVCADAALALVICDADARPLVPEGQAVMGFDEIRALPDAGPAPAVEPQADETAMVLYTSGSTGRPKGVPLSHAGQRWVIDQRSAAADYAAHRMLVAAPLCHMNALLMSKLAAFNGAEIVLLPEFTPQGYIDAIDRYRCTWITSVPTMLALVARETEALARADMGSVRIAAMGSAPVSPALFQTVGRLFPNAAVVTNYGTTEAGAGIFGAHPRGLPRPMLSVGVPVPGIGFRLIGDDGRPGSEGVLQVNSPAMTRGYLNRPEATARLFTADGWIDTGDIFRQDDEGFCFFLRRADDMFVCGGENVHPAAVEEVLLGHPAVEQACVVPVPDELKGAKPVAYVVLRAGAEATEEALKDHALAHAAAYMHPRRVFFLDRLPLSPTNKIDRAALIRRAGGARPAQAVGA